MVAALRLEHDPAAAPRDGLLFAFVMGTVPGQLLESPRDAGPGPAGIFAISAQGRDGNVIGGAVRSRPTGLAWRPERVLEAQQTYTLTWQIDPNSTCFSAAPIEQTISVVTEAQLREPPPALLEGIRVGEAWLELSTPSCCHTESVHCQERAPCLACVDQLHALVLLPDVRKSPSGEDQSGLVTSLEITDATGEVHVNRPDNWREQSLTPIFPLGDTRIDWPPDPVRICIAADSESYRTGAISSARVCIDVDAQSLERGGTLAQGALPARVTLEAPERAAYVGERPCSSDAAPHSDGRYAVWFARSLPGGAQLDYGVPRMAARESDGNGDAGSPGPAASAAAPEATPSCQCLSTRAPSTCALSATALLALGLLGRRRRSMQ